MLQTEAEDAGWYAAVLVNRKRYMATIKTLANTSLNTPTL